jgi:hypothetical protein
MASIQVSEILQFTQRDAMRISFHQQIWTMNWKFSIESIEDTRYGDMVNKHGWPRNYQSGIDEMNSFHGKIIECCLDGIQMGHCRGCFWETYTMK